MDLDLFDFEMNKAGYKTAKERADAIGITESQYYSRTNRKGKRTEFTLPEMQKVSELLGTDIASAIFLA